MPSMMTALEFSAIDRFDLIILIGDDEDDDDIIALL
jgi:hypothetical protein